MNRLLTYTLEGTTELFLSGEVPNPNHLCQIFVCGTDIRDMAGLLKKHLPDEHIAPCDIARTSMKFWPACMHWIKPERGVWGVRFPNGVHIFRFIEGQRTEVD